MFCLCLLFALGTDFFHGYSLIVFGSTVFIFKILAPNSAKMLCRPTQHFAILVRKCRLSNLAFGFLIMEKRRREIVK